MTIQKRLSELEAKTKQGCQPFYMAIVQDDGTVKVSSVKNKFTLPSEQALDDWVDDNRLNDSEQIRGFKVIIEDA